MVDGIYNAQIESTCLGLYDGTGPLFFYIRTIFYDDEHPSLSTPDYCSDFTTQFGHFVTPSLGPTEYISYPYTDELIRETLKVIGVNKWEDLPNKYLRIKITDGIITDIGHITKNKWFNIHKFFKEKPEVK